MTVTRAATYAKRSMGITYDKAFFENEFGNIQRAIEPTVLLPLTVSRTQQGDDRVIWADATAGAITYTLIAASLAGPFQVTVKKVDSSANAVTIAGTIDGVVNPTLALQYASMSFRSDGTSWYRDIDTAILAGGLTFHGDLLFSADATYDIGKTGATRPRDGFFSRNVVIGGTETVTGAFGCNAKTAQTAAASGGALNAYAAGVNGLFAAGDMAALHAMVVTIRAALVANGIMS